MPRPFLTNGETPLEFPGGNKARFMEEWYKISKYRPSSYLVKVQDIDFSRSL